MLYNDSVGKKTISKCQRTEEFTRKLCALLYYVHTNTYNKINCKCPSVLVMQCYRLIIFHTQRRFCAGLSVRVINSVHPVTYVGTFCINKPSHKIYCCIPALSTRHYTLLHNTKILHTKKFFARSCHLRK